MNVDEVSLKNDFYHFYSPKRKELVLVTVVVEYYLPWHVGRMRVCGWARRVEGAGRYRGRSHPCLSYIRTGGVAL